MISWFDYLEEMRTFNCLRVEYTQQPIQENVESYVFNIGLFEWSAFMGLVNNQQNQDEVVLLLGSRCS
jgi:hypothetical protein